MDIRQSFLRFRVKDDLRPGYTVSGDDGLYNATLTNISSSDPSKRYGNLTSELSVLIVQGQTIEVVCDDGTTGNRSIEVSPGAVD